MTTELALLASGCFWGVQQRFSQLPGVINTSVGYTGGHLDQPNYASVCRGDSGHAEAILITFDPQQINFERLLRFFFEQHDPTTLNRQGPDHGSQYRSAIFYYNDEQQQTALQLIETLNLEGDYTAPIVTEVTAASAFFAAEDEHQDYWRKHR